MLALANFFLVFSCGNSVCMLKVFINVKLEIVLVVNGEQN